LGNNGPHSVSTQEAIKFHRIEDQEWQTGQPCGPTAKSANLQNVHIRNATASNGTIDHFKWDPEGPEALKQPHITFDIVDCDPHKYRWVVYFRESAGSET